MKDKFYRLLNRTTTLDVAVTACMVTFLVTLLITAGWMAAMVGGWNNLLQAVKFGQVLRVIDRVYIGEANTEAVADLAFNAMIDSLGDRWSMYFTREEYDRYLQVQSNTYVGVGFTMRLTEQGWLVISVTADSPAEKAGITPDMYLLEVNGVRLTEESASEISAMMQENDGHAAVVMLDIHGQEQTFAMTLEKIYSNPVSYVLLEGSIGYIALENFDETSGEQAIEAVEALMEQGAKALVFDVRDNGGGYLKELNLLLDYLLPEGEIFVSVDHKGEETVTESDKSFVDLPMAVLVNENSYSAAEFFAAALREYDSATLVGMPTTGKNRSQTNAVLIDGSAVHISSKRYLTPNRVDLTVQGGLTPDVQVEPGVDDPQLAAALALLQ